MKETMTVEYDVEKTVRRGYGYEEKLLRFKGTNIRSKAIVKDGQHIAIVGRGYRLIPNEFVEEKVDGLGGTGSSNFRSCI
jgi:hypothetical protein